MPKFETKSFLFGHFWAIILKILAIFEISTLKLVKNDSLTEMVNFYVESAFSKCQGSPFSESPGSGPGPFCKVCLLATPNFSQSEIITFN